jgi:DNA modification methylase
VTAFCEAMSAQANDVVRADAVDLLRSLDAGSVQVIIADPPYGIAYHSNYYVDKNPHAPIARDWNFQIGAFFDEAARVLSEGGALYLFTRWDVYPLWAGQSPRELALKNLIVWEKDNWSSGDLTGNFGNQYELMMFLTKGRHQIRGHRFPNVWKFPRIPAKRLRMPAEKPVGLYHRAILASSDPGDLIVDPFCGSGTAAEAATLIDRRFLLGDLEPSMVAMARRRVGLPVIAQDAPSAVPRCPVFGIEPPDISLWGLHPEDVCAALGQNCEPAEEVDPAPQLVLIR